MGLMEDIIIVLGVSAVVFLYAGIAWHAAGWFQGFTARRKRQRKDKEEEAE